MANLTQSFADNNGQLHKTAEAAIVADIACALGSLSQEYGVARGLAKLILDRRTDIERAFADYDQLTVQS